MTGFRGALRRVWPVFALVLVACGSSAPNATHGSGALVATTTPAAITTLAPGSTDGWTATTRVGVPTSAPRPGVTVTAPADVCAGGTPLGGFSNSAGTTDVRQSPDGRWVCFVPSDGRPPAVLDVAPVQAAVPHLISIAVVAGATVYAFAVPTAWEAGGVTARTGADGVLPVMTLTSGDRVLVFDVGNAAASTTSRSFTLQRSDGAVVGTLTVPGGGGEAVDPQESAEGLLACLRSQGLRLPAPPGVDPGGGGLVPAPTSVGTPAPDAQPYDPPTITADAWRACHALAEVAARGAGAPPGLLSFLDCMAERGWIQMFRGPIKDAAVHDADARACTTS